MSDKTPKKTSKDKDFGLPKTKFKPINRTRIVSKKNNKRNNNNIIKGIIFCIIILMLLSIGTGIFYWLKNKNIEEEEIEETEQEDSSSIFEDKEEKEIQEEPIQKEEEEIEQKDEIKEEDIVTKEIEIEEAKEIAKPIIGTITKIREPQNAYFIIISSSIDEDLANDYAKKLSKKGKSVMVIFPSKKGLYHRVSLAKANTMQEAIEYSKDLKLEFGDKIWIMKY